MTKFRGAFLLLVFILAACQSEADHLGESSKHATQGRKSVSPFRNPVTMSDSSQRSAEAAPPDPGEVLRAIYKQEGDGSSSYELEGQIWATYWYGHDYEFDGRRYFTGFAYNTVEKPDDDADIPAPGDQVAISQATYVRAPEGSVALWEFVSAERDIGKFGGFEKGSTVDEGLLPQSYLTEAGNYLLAVTAWNLESGIRLRTAEVFVRKHGQDHWQYAGSIATGEDNSAGCASDAAAEGLPPCAVSVGKLEFQPRPDVEMPPIRVAMMGKVIHSPGMTGNLGSRDVAEYRYDQAVSKYQLVQR